MAKLYEMCNEINSDEILSDREALTKEEKDKLLADFKEGKDTGYQYGKNKKQKKTWSSYIGKAAVAAALAILIVPNVSANAAYAMAQIPLLRPILKKQSL